MFRHLAVTATCGVAALASAQPTYEIGYSFNGLPDVVRVDGVPFSVQVEADSAVEQELSMRFPFVSDVGAGFVEARSRVFRDDGPGSPLQSIGWSDVAFNDVVFQSSEADPISVSFSIQYPSTLIFISSATEGTELRLDYEIELNGDVRIGSFIGTVTSTGGLRSERTGFIEGGIPPDGVIALDGFTVPANLPVSLRFRATQAITAPASDGRLLLQLKPGSALDLAFDEDVFSVADNVTVHSIQAGIVDNQRVRCVADLDADGELTIFDFLAFQNLFGAGDPTADFDGDGELTLFDFLAFQNAFDAGCP